MAEEDESAPLELTFDEQVFDLCFHSEEDLVASALVTGEVFVHQYGLEENIEKFKLTHHTGACRSVQFADDGKYLFTAAADASIRAIDMSTGAISFEKLDAHDSPINAMMVSSTILATGDDEGFVKIWDLRQRKNTFEFRDNDDFISSFAYRPEKKMLLAAGGDGRLSVFQIRKGILEARSDEQDDELLSICIVKGGRKVICGTQDGVLATFSWGNWGDISDRFPGHPSSVDTLVKIDEDTVASGSSDGLIRIVGLQPNKLLGVIGEHENYPIERIRLSRDHRFMGSCSHDCTVKFWNVSYLFEDDDDDDEEEGEEAEVEIEGEAAAEDEAEAEAEAEGEGEGEGEGAAAGGEAVEDADADGDEASSSSSSSDDDEDSDEDMGGRRGKKRGGRAKIRRPGKPRQRSFFADI